MSKIELEQNKYNFDIDGDVTVVSEDTINLQKDESISKLIDMLSHQPLDVINSEKCDILLEIFKLLKDTYSGDFRHSYSNIFNVMVRLIPDNSEVFDSNDNALENLNNNTQLLKEILSKVTILSKGSKSELVDIVYNLSENDDFKRKFFKLYDHIALEYARIAFSSSKTDPLAKQVKNITVSANDTAKTVKKVSNKSEKIYKKAQKMQREYVTILGVFASVLAVFFSGIGFSTATLSNMKEVSVYRFSFSILLLGFVLFNILALLMNFIRDMVVTHKGHKCIVIIGNIVLGVLLVVTYFAWKGQCWGSGTI